MPPDGAPTSDLPWEENGCICAKYAAMGVSHCSNGVVMGTCVLTDGRPEGVGAPIDDVGVRAAAAAMAREYCSISAGYAFMYAATASSSADAGCGDDMAAPTIAGGGGGGGGSNTFSTPGRDGAVGVMTYGYVAIRYWWYAAAFWAFWALLWCGSSLRTPSGAVVAPYAVGDAECC